MIVNITTTSDHDFVRNFILQTSSGVAIDLTGSDLLMQARSDPAAAAVAVEMSTHVANGNILITTPLAGAFRLTIPYAKLQPLVTGLYYHSLIRIYLGSRTEVWSGTLQHNAGPTLGATQ